MVKVRTIPPNGRDLFKESETLKVLRPSNLSVRYESSRSVVPLVIEFDNYSHVLGLSPPEAKQLARELNKAVKTYLNSASETE